MSTSCTYFSTMCGLIFGSWILSVFHGKVCKLPPKDKSMIKFAKRSYQRPLRSVYKQFSLLLALIIRIRKTWVTWFEGLNPWFHNQIMFSKKWYQWFIQCLTHYYPKRDFTIELFVMHIYKLNILHVIILGTLQVISCGVCLLLSLLSLFDIWSTTRLWSFEAFVS